jgi:cation:H+ antiporter
VIHFVLLIVCAAVIYLACEWFVNAVEWLGQRLKVGPLAVGTCGARKVGSGYAAWSR